MASLIKTLLMAALMRLPAEIGHPAGRLLRRVWPGIRAC